MGNCSELRAHGACFEASVSDLGSRVQVGSSTTSYKVGVLLLHNNNNSSCVSGKNNSNNNGSNSKHVIGFTGLVFCFEHVSHSLHS